MGLKIKTSPYFIIEVRLHGRPKPVLCVFVLEYWRRLFGSDMIEEVAWNKSSLLLRNILQNLQTLQTFTINIKTESVCNSFFNGKLAGLGKKT